MARNMKADRAKLFIPFDALKGYKEALREKERIVCDKKILSEEQMEELSNKILAIRKRDIVKLIYFEKDEYLELTGMVSSIDYIERTITIIKTKIKFDDIYEIEREN